MLFCVVATSLLFLYQSEAITKVKGTVAVVKTVLVPAPVPAKCNTCANAAVIRCGQNVDGKGNNCVCGLDSNNVFACDADACCESTPADCCEDSSSKSYTCDRSLCTCAGGGISGVDPLACKTSPVQCCPAFIRDGGRNLNELSDLNFKLNELSDLSFDGTEGEYKEFIDICGDHDYKVSLYVDDSHFSGIAIPANDIDTACPSFVVAHVLFNEEEPATKELLGWYNKGEGMSYFPQESAPIGTFKAKDIAFAFETAEPSGAGAYDYLTNNCANFMINMANVLGVKVDSTITAYVTRRLLEDSGSALVDKIKESTHFLSYFDGRHLRGDMRDEELLQLVVDARATDIMA